MDNRTCPAKKKGRPELNMSIGLQTLNFLSLPQEAVRLSAVCSHLRKPWVHHPDLDFDISTVPAKGNQGSGRYGRMLDIKRFIDTVNFILSEHSGFAVNGLAVEFELHKEHANDIDGWVYFAIVSKARMAVLNFSPYLGPYDNYYNFPGHLFNNQNSSHLQVLQLYRVNLQYLLLKCPVLERLSIRLCPELHDLYAAEPLQQLKFLCVQHCAMVPCVIRKIDLHAPNLTAFEDRGSSNKTLDMFFTEIPNVLRSLHVEVHVNTQIHGFTQAPLRFMYLRHFSVNIILPGAKRSSKNAILQLAYILEAAPFLADLHLDMNCASFCEYPPKQDVIANRRHHNLKQACITGFNGNGGQVALVKYILRNAVQLKRMVIDPREKPVVQQMREHIGRISAESELVPRDRKGVPTIL
ncbi:hypothetical protein BS78_08G004500 [Paspalum vaginatum]|nr:hypothetical protein BS78_08G004500 [Paspalum vaginatum]